MFPRLATRDPIAYFRGGHSLDAAHVRPRGDGWIALQEHASELVREAITTGGHARQVVDEINRRYAALGDVPVRRKVASR